MRFTKKHLDILAETFLFKGVEPDRLREIITMPGTEVRVYQKLEQIYDRDSFHKELGIILKGRIKVTKGSLVVSELTEGELFGAAALFNDETKYVSELTAMTECRILFLSQKTMEQVMDTNPAISINYVRYLSGRIRFLSSKLDAISQDSSAEKLYAWLLQNMDTQGLVEPPCSMKELAARMNISRATLYRELENLKKEGMIEQDGKRILVLRKESLS